jgi:hypothetical protein
LPEHPVNGFYPLLNILSLFFSLGNPVELSKPVLVSNTQQFKVYAIKSDSVIEPTFHPCLQARVQSANASSMYQYTKCSDSFAKAFVNTLVCQYFIDN